MRTCFPLFAAQHVYEEPEDKISSDFRTKRNTVNGCFDRL